MITKTLNIPDAFFAQYKTALVKVRPVPIDSETSEPLYTDAEWVLEDFKKTIKQHVEMLKSRSAHIDAQSAVVENNEELGII